MSRQRRATAQYSAASGLIGRLLEMGARHESFIVALAFMVTGVELVCNDGAW